MNDKPSQKPPSLYLKPNPSSSNVLLTYEDLMEDYYQNSMTNHPNASVTSQATAATSTTSRESGFARFGRNVATSLKTSNFWQKITTSSKKPKPILEHETESELVGRQIRAEEAYAQFKSIGTRTSSMATVRQRQTPLQLDTNPQISLSENMSPQRISQTPGKGSLSKRFHLRTPSLHDLKRIASESTIHRRTASATLDRIIDIENDEALMLRSAKSKKELAKQEKLSRRVSDLEAKLEAAKKNLEVVKVKTHGPAPPKPVTRGGRVLRFRPMPSLPSESLLNHLDNSNSAATSTCRKQAVTVEPLLELPSSPENSDVFSKIDASIMSSPSYKPVPELSRLPSQSDLNSPPPFNLSAFKPHNRHSSQSNSMDIEPSYISEVTNGLYIGAAPAVFSKIPLNSPPLRPTALATPAAMPGHQRRQSRQDHPSHERTRSMSPIKDTVDYRDRSEPEEHRIPRRAVPSDAKSKTHQRETSKKVVAQQDIINAPSLPTEIIQVDEKTNADKKDLTGLEVLEEEFEWPDDVF
jgi:hypothetical protein